MSRLSFGDLKRIQRLVDELGASGPDLDAFAGKILDRLLGLVVVRGPSTALRLDRFFSEDGQVIGEAHRNVPSEQVLETWRKHIRSASSSIEGRLHQRSSDRRIDFATIGELFETEEWESDPLADLAHRAGVGDMAYLWLRTHPGEVWAFCLRRLESEAPFSSREQSVIVAFGNELRRGRLVSHAVEAGSHPLSERQWEVLATRAEVRTDGDAASRLGISLSAVQDSLQRTRRQLGVRTTLQAIRIAFWQEE